MGHFDVDGVMPPVAQVNRGGAVLPGVAQQVGARLDAALLLASEQ